MKRNMVNWVAVKELKLSYHNGYIMENQMEKTMENEMETVVI